MRAADTQILQAKGQKRRRVERIAQKNCSWKRRKREKKRRKEEEERRRTATNFRQQNASALTNFKTTKNTEQILEGISSEFLIKQLTILKRTQLKVTWKEFAGPKATELDFEKLQPCGKKKKKKEEESNGPLQSHTFT